MNKWILLIAFCGLSNTAMAQQYSVKVCDNLERELKKLSTTANLNISEKQHQRLTQRKKTLFASITHNCDLAEQSLSYKIPNNNVLVKKSLTDRSVYSRRYSSENKQAAWVNYYKTPQKCKRLEMSNSEFAWCSKNRAKQRTEFEYQWQQRAYPEINPDDEVHEIVLPKESTTQIKPSTTLLSVHNTNFTHIALFGVSSFLLLIAGYSWLLRNKHYK